MLLLLLLFFSGSGVYQRHRVQECTGTKVTGTKLWAGQCSTGESQGPAGSHCHQELLRPRKGSLEAKHLCTVPGKCVPHQGRYKQSLLKSLSKGTFQITSRPPRGDCPLSRVLSFQPRWELFKHQVTNVSRKENKQAARGEPALGASMLSETLQLVGSIRMTQEWSTHRALRPLGLWGLNLRFVP